MTQGSSETSVTISLNTALTKLRYFYIRKKVRNLNFALEQAMKAQRRSRVIALSALSLTSALDGGGWLRPWSLYLWERDPLPIVEEAGWAPGSVCTSAENLSSTGTRSSDHPNRSESLYRLSHLVPLHIFVCEDC